MGRAKGRRGEEAVVIPSGACPAEGRIEGQGEAVGPQLSPDPSRTLRSRGEPVRVVRS